MSDLEGLLRRAIGGDGHHVQRLGSAGVTVTFRVGGDKPITLLLDRQPPEVDTSSEGDVTIDIDGDQAERFARGELVLSTCFMRGTASYEGDIRRYLVVDPILRGLLIALREEAE